ncbi:MAG: hypothetical protein IT572_04515 [Deltaproteobacteria bacterium]|nr:hypothetical protein [Deltaproteobacteria bacterium]
MVDGIRGPNQFDGIFSRGAAADRGASLCAPAFLARLLGEAARIPEWVEGPPPEDLARAFAGLGASARGRLLTLIPESTLQEIFALAEERDPAQFLEALFHLARGLENTDRLPAAAALYAGLAALPDPSPARDGARSRLDAVLGRGDAWARAEFLVRRLAAHSTEIASLGGMVLAGIGYARARLGVAALLGSTAANPLTRGLGARFLSGTAGLLLEAPAFVLGSRILRRITGERAASEQGSGTQELLGAYLSFGAMHLVGGLGSLALGAWGREAFGEGALRAVLPSLSLFAGLLLGRRLEEELGLRERQPRATTFTDALATLLQLRVAARLLPTTASPETLIRRALLETAPSGRESPGRVAPAFSWHGRLAPALHPAGAGVPATGREGPPRRDPLREHIVFMSSDSEGPGGGSSRPGRPGAKVIYLDAVRAGRRREDPTPRRVETESPDPESLSRRMLAADDPDLWIESLRHAMVTWHPVQSVRQFNADFFTIESRLGQQPAYVSGLLGHLAIRDAAAAKTLLVLLDLAPAHSWLRMDAEVQTAIRRRAGEVLSEEELQDTAHVLHSRFVTATARPHPGNAFAHRRGELLWREKLTRVPAVFLPALRDVTLGDKQFLFLTRHLGFHAENYPE